MKKLGVFGVVVIVLLAMSGMANAVEIKARGYWWMEAVSRSNWDFLGAGEDQHFSIEEKLRTQFQFIANENLRGVLDTQIGTNNWGNGLYSIGAGRTPNVTTGTSGANIAGDGNIMLRQGYVEYLWPGTKMNFKVGFQTLTLPAAFGGGSAIMDDQVAAAVFSAPIGENIAILAGYARPYDTNAYGAATTLPGHGTATDVLFAALPITFKGGNVTPFAAYVNSGFQTASATSGATSLRGFTGPNATTSEGLHGYWGGVAATVTALDNFKGMADFNYGNVAYNNNNVSAGRRGFLFDAAIDYTAMSMMTPELFFAYSSGENGNSSKGGVSERMPVVATPQNWKIGSFFFGERLELAGFIPTAGYTSTTLGYWAAGFSLKDIALVDKLKHDFNLLYAQGTNSKDYIKELNNGGVSNVRNANYGGFLTTKDSLWEVDFNSRYSIYDELQVLLYLGYIKADFDKNVWGASSLTTASQIQQTGSKDAYKIGLGINYFF